MKYWAIRNKTTGKLYIRHYWSQEPNNPKGPTLWTTKKAAKGSCEYYEEPVRVELTVVEKQEKK